MKAWDYLRRKKWRAAAQRLQRSGLPRELTRGPGPRIEVNTPTTLVMSGTTEDIDTPEKRAAIASFVTGYTPPEEEADK